MKVGIIGAGQLGRMLALAGYPLGIHCTFLDRDDRSPGGLVSDILVGELDDAEKLDELARAVDVVTFEFENVPVGALDQAAETAPVYPPAAALATAQDRLEEKRLFEKSGIATAPFVTIDTEADLNSAAALGWPLVLKARRLGYDGRGQRFVTSATELEAAWLDLGRVPCIAEGWVEFQRELSLIAVRGASGEMRFYPLAENDHRDGILNTTVAPYENDDLQKQAQGWLSDLMEGFDYRGVLTVEFFHTAAGLVANEMAPRVHNSGHWTIEGAETSQFENHLRAVLGLPLGDTTPRGHAAMLNLLGRMPARAEVLGIPGAHLHDYGKEARPKRKLGHCTVLGADRETVLEHLRRVEAAVEHSAIA